MTNTDITRQLETLVRLLAISITDGKKRVDQVSLLTRAGLKPKEIAELLGTTPHTVSVLLSEHRAKTSGPRRPSGD